MPDDFPPPILAGCRLIANYGENGAVLRCKCGETFHALGEAVSDAIAAEETLECAECRDAPPPQCRVCGCTDEDCSGCIARTGEPCTWVEADLCSACVVGPPASEVVSTVVIGPLVPHESPVQMLVQNAVPLPTYRKPAHVRHNTEGNGEPCYDTILRAFEVCRLHDKLSPGGSASLEQLVVTAWELNPARYGLPGYPYPDSRRIYTEIIKMCQTKCPHIGGLLTKTRVLMYKPTAKGRQRIREQGGKK